MKYNTRIVPTINGEPHIGHAYLALVNEYEAHASGGLFTVRYDDSQAEWADRLGYRAVHALKLHWRHDLEWLGVQVDCWESQTEMQYEAHKLLLVRCAEAGVRMPTPVYFNPDAPSIHAPSAGYYPYADYLTAEMVIMDHMEGVNWLIRGLDLATQHTLYLYYAEHFTYCGIRCDYLHRLMATGGEELTDVSKTAGGWKISDYRAKGWTPESVLNLLRMSCLVDTTGPFSVANCSTTPRIGKGLD